MDWRVFLILLVFAVMVLTAISKWTYRRSSRGANRRDGGDSGWGWFFLSDGVGGADGDSGCDGGGDGGGGDGGGGD